MGKKKNKKKPAIQPIKKKKVRIKYRNILFFVLVLCLIGYLVYGVSRISITNIYIEGNTYLTDQQVIEAAGIQNYPPIIETLSFTVEEKLKKTSTIKGAHITRPSLRAIHIQITENTPLFYDSTKSKTILSDGKETKEKYDAPVLLNYVPDQKYQKFLEKMSQISPNIIEKISEIKYDPNDKDDERFLLSMNDGNYAYLSLSKFEKIDQYLNIVLEMSKKFNNQKGILYLDSGGYFKVIEG